MWTSRRRRGRHRCEREFRDDVSDVELKDPKYPDDLGEPPVAVPKDDELPKLRVELKFCIDEISSIDTLNGTMAAKVWTGLAWNDPRLCGETEFPKNCWMDAILRNSAAGTDFVYEEKKTKITDSESGQCYRLSYGEGNFACAFDLHEYPFDSQKLSFVVRTISMHAVNSKLKSNPVRFEDYGSMAKRVYPKEPPPPMGVQVPVVKVSRVSPRCRGMSPRCRGRVAVCRASVAGGSPPVAPPSRSVAPPTRRVAVSQGVVGCCGVSRAGRRPSRRRRERVATRRAAVAVCRGVSRVSRAI